MTNTKLKWHFHLLDAFLIFVPLSIILYFVHVASLLSFLITAAALIGMAHLMAESTSIIANRVSSTISALVNATFGNAVELFIAVFSLRAGLFALVTASITGSILLNVLLLIGLAMLAGGLGLAAVVGCQPGETAKPKDAASTEPASSSMAASGAVAASRAAAASGPLAERGT